MSCTLRDFHFNAIKLGQILKQLCQEKKASYSYLVRETDISRDTIENIMRGAVRDVKFEQLFKICVVLEVPLAVIEMLMIKDEDIDFVVPVYDAKSGDVLPVTDVDTDQIPVADAVVAVAEAVTETAAAAGNLPTPVLHTADNTAHVAFLQDMVVRLLDMLDKANDRRSCL